MTLLLLPIICGVIYLRESSWLHLELIFEYTEFVLYKLLFTWWSFIIS